MNAYLTKCNHCGGATSRKYSREHAGLCKACFEPETRSMRPTRNERIIDSGWQAYAREEGHYDLPDNY